MTTHHLDGQIEMDLRTEDDGPDAPDGPWAEGWEHRRGHAGPTTEQERIYAHKWECIDEYPSLYDTNYRCRKCKQVRMESIDNPDSALPAFGCRGEA